MGNPGARHTPSTERRSRALDVTQPPPRSGTFPVQSSPEPAAILLVAPNANFDDLCRSELVDAGFLFVFSISNCDRALELIGLKLFDAVVVGVDAGNVQTVKLAQRLQRHCWNVPTFIVPALEGEGLAAAVFNHPIGANSLGQSIRELLSLRRSNRTE